MNLVKLKALVLQPSTPIVQQLLLTFGSDQLVLKLIRVVFTMCVCSVFTMHVCVCVHVHVLYIHST